ncbi:hypothetical protein [Pseudoxanthomonas winnipegensis]|uniref:hypothetical protein n=1 Tax=Pseudoxanthomonas winnipegensis TaxID=2480810 RepID=UPI003F84CFE9
MSTITYIVLGTKGFGSGGTPPQPSSLLRSGPLPDRPRCHRDAGEGWQDDGKEVARAFEQYKIDVDKVNSDGHGPQMMSCRRLRKGGHP